MNLVSGSDTDNQLVEFYGFVDFQLNRVRKTLSSLAEKFKLPCHVSGYDIKIDSSILARFSQRLYSTVTLKLYNSYALLYRLFD